MRSALDMGRVKDLLYRMANQHQNTFSNKVNFAEVTSQVMAQLDSATRLESSVHFFFVALLHIVNENNWNLQQDTLEELYLIT